jgi:hypothetical protein
MESFKSLLKKIKDKPSDFPLHTITKFDEIIDLIKKIDGVKSDVYLDSFNDLDRIRFSAVLSDFTNIFPRDLDGGGRIIINKNATHSFTASDKIISSILHENAEPIMQAGFIVPSDEKVKKILQEIEPLIEIEKALYSNPRVLIGLTDKKEDDGGKVWKVFDVEPSSPTGDWLAMEDSGKINSLPINFNTSCIQNKNELFDVTIPYLKGVTFKDLALILKDNEDILCQFRLNLSKTIEYAKSDGKSIEEMKNDIIRPEIDKISKEFKSTKNIHKLKVSGITVSTVTLGLLSYSSTGLSQIIGGFLGTGGLGLLIKQEAEFQKEISELQNNPFYLMWKFKTEKNIA